MRLDFDPDDARNAKSLTRILQLRGLEHVAAAHGVFTGAIVSLLPSMDDAERLVIEGYEPLESLHMTLTWLGDTADDAPVQPDLDYDEACARVREIVDGLDAIQADVFAVATFNPGQADPERTPATVLLAQGDTLSLLREAVVGAVGDASEFPVWFPHVTLGYNCDDPNWNVDERMGEVTFDRLVVSYGSDRQEVFELGKNKETRDLVSTAMKPNLQASTMPLLRFLSANIRAATLVDIPAFPNARIRLVGEPDAEGMQAWEGEIAFERTETGDARSFDKFTWTDPPLPLRWASEDEGWHMGAEVVGRIDALALEGDAIMGRGVIDTTWPPGAAVCSLIAKQMCGGVSVDMDEIDVADPEVDDEEGEDPIDELLAAVVGDTSLPIADRDYEWDGGGATGRVFDMFTNDEGNVDVDGVSKAFLYRDEDADPATRGAYKLGFADVVDGTLTIVPRGVFATAGGRGVDSADVPSDDKDGIKSRICSLYARLADEFDDDSIVCPFDDSMADEVIEASAWSEMEKMPPPPRAWFEEPQDLPQDKGAVFADGGRVYGWVARRGVRHEVLGKTPPLDDVDLTTFLRRPLVLDDGSEVRVGAFTMNVGHHRDGAECETGACQFDDTRTVAGIVTVGVNEGGMWFSGAASPWISAWDREVFLTCQGSGHWRYEKGRWWLRGVLTVPMPAYPTRLVASAFVHRANTALRAAAPIEEKELVVRFDESQLATIAGNVISELERRAQRDELAEQVRSVEVARLEESVHGVRTVR